MKAFLRAMFVDFPLVVVFVVGHFLGFIKGDNEPTTYSDTDLDED